MTYESTIATSCAGTGLPTYAIQVGNKWYLTIPVICLMLNAELQHT